MKIFTYKNSTKRKILALGAESAGNFSVFSEEKIFFSEDFGDLLIDANYRQFKKELARFLEKESIRPDVILTDLHPLMKTTVLGQELGKKYKARHVQIQHHHAHIFSAIGEKMASDPCYGVALDGTGYGENGKIWGGECFAISNLPAGRQVSHQFLDLNDKILKQEMQVERIGHLENQTLLGGELAIQEPARMLLSILAKIPSHKKRAIDKFQPSDFNTQKDFVFSFVKLYYSRNEFELLYNQLEQNFNCIETSSAGRILDAVSFLLGFCKNKRAYKHESIFLLEANSTKPYIDIKPRIESIESNSISNFQPCLPAGRFPISNQFSMTKIPKKYFILNTTYLFEYLIQNLHKDKRRLAATAQLYIAQGLYEIIQKQHRLRTTNHGPRTVFASGGLTNNKIISRYFTSKNIYLNKNIPRGDAGLSFGQIMFFFADP
jgi:hydrogenase maturation protein HypF